MLTKEIIIEAINPILMTYPVKRAALFGSFIKGEQNEASDIDLVFEFYEEPGIKYFGLREDLKNVLGINVDTLFLRQLLSDKDSDVYGTMRSNILNDLEWFYELQS
jgi:predicted nucleotidyltransferase